MNISERIDAFVNTGKKITEFLHTFYDDDSSEFIQTLKKTYKLNPWFTIAEQKKALSAIANWLNEGELTAWVKNYPAIMSSNSSPKIIGVIMAGNIPMVGFQDFLCVLISGHKLRAKCASDDNVLLPWFAKILTETEPRFKDSISFTDRISNIDAVIGTGSNNSARYFEYYFGKYPHIIRKNRNAIAILSGKESIEELQLLGKDIFSYFGLGCRNVSKIYVPEKYDFSSFFPAMEIYSSVLEHNKYMNNFDYNNAILLMNRVQFLTNNFLIVLENKSIPSPVSVLHFEYYMDFQTLTEELSNLQEQVQCIVSGNKVNSSFIPFGQTQNPGLMDYADGVDVMKFLENI